jgi:O-antigen ligase
VRSPRLRDFLFTALVAVYTYGLAVLLMTVLSFTAYAEMGRRVFRWERSPLDRPLQWLLAAAFLSAFLSPWRGLAIVSSLVLALVILHIVRPTLLYARSLDRIWRLLLIWVGGGAVAALFALERALPEGGLRPVLIGLRQNNFGATLAVAAIMAAGLLLSATFRYRALAAAAVVVTLAALAATFARAAWLGTLAGLLTLFVAGRPRARLALGLAALALVVAGVAATPAWPRLWTEVRSIPSLEVNRNRLYVWRTAIDIARRSPLVGVGFGAFGPAYQLHRPAEAPDKSAPAAHNFVLNFAAETGLLGLAAILALCAVALREQWRWWSRSPAESRSRDAATCVLAATVTFLVVQLFTVSLMVTDVGIGLFLLFALGAAGARTLTRGDEQSPRP